MQRHNRRLLKGSDGYTLTEMLVVIGIIALIAAVLTPTLLGQMQRARAKAAKLQLDTVASAVELFRSDVGRYPTADEKLSVLVANNSLIEGWTGPYLKDAKTLKDPWGRDIAYKLELDGEGFIVSTLGADNKAGGSGANLDLQAPTNISTVAAGS
jgi:general secretion pathway protein G